MASLLILNAWGQIPANDDCANATLITSSPFDINQDASAATNNAGGIDVCGSPAWGMNDGVWYRLTGTGGDVNLSVLPNGWNCQVDVYSGSCGSFTCIVGLNDGATDEMEQGMFFADTNIEYFINIGHWAYDANQPQADSPEGPFVLHVDGALLNVAPNKIDHFSIYLNPVNHFLNLSANENIVKVQIFDLSGKEILTTNPNQMAVNFNLSSYNNGLYLVKISTVSQSGTYKIIK